MTLSRRHKATIALCALLAFLSQGAFAALGSHVHVGGDTSVAPAEVVDTAHDHAQHGANTEDIGVAVHSSDKDCDESRTCLCCIGSCASLMPAAAADTLAIPVSSLRFMIMRFLTATAATSLYRPPILA